MKSHETIAVVPVYEPMVGNVCQLYNLQGETEIAPITVGAQMSRFYRERELDEARRIQWIRSLLGRKKNLPVALGSECLFVPVKVRIPIAKNDGANAYVRLSAVSHVRKRSVTFVTGESLDCLQTERSIRATLQQAKLLATCMAERESRERLEWKISELMLHHLSGNAPSQPGMAAESEVPFLVNPTGFV